MGPDGEVGEEEVGWEKPSKDEYWREDNPSGGGREPWQAKRRDRERKEARERTARQIRYVVERGLRERAMLLTARIWGTSSMDT